MLPAEERVGVRSQGRQGDGDVEQQQTKQLILLIKGGVVWRGNMIIVTEYVREDAFVSRICAVFLPVCKLPMAAMRVGSMLH